jgi:hypothetical protein
VICKCGHDARLHHHSKSCTGYIDEVRLKFCSCSELRESNLTTEEGVLMAKQKLGKKIVLFEVTDKNADDLLEKGNTTNAAIFYRVLAAKAEAMTRLAIYEASESKCESKAAWERLGNQTHDTLARLRKEGFVKRTETREKIEPAAKKARPKRAKTNGALSAAA